LGFSYTRGFILFLLMVPLIIARPSAQQVSFLKPQTAANDPVLRFFRQNPRGIALICLCLAIFATFFTWSFQHIEPPLSTAPNGAVDYVKRHVTGRVFNSYDFGGYLIFSDIPTFVDGRADLYGDDFLQKYFAVINLADLPASLRMLDDERIDCAI